MAGRVRRQLRSNVVDSTRWPSWRLIAGLTVLAVSALAATPGVASAADVQRVEVQAPSEIAGTYTAGPTSGGTLAAFQVTGTVVLALDEANPSGPSTTDACTPLTNAAEVKGKIALFDRGPTGGTCTFAMKAANAEAAGAIGAIIVNNRPGGDIGGGAIGITIGTDPIRIPVILISLEDGDRIKPHLAGGVTAKLIGEPDRDQDGRADSVDNCPDVTNTDQANNDGDAQGDACDPDDDNDGVNDPADGCPTVAAPTADGCPAPSGTGDTGGTGGNTPPPSPSQFDRTLSLSYSARKDVFAGKLASQGASCISSQKVSVFENKKGRDPKVGTATTSATGRYSLKQKNAEGRFYATVGQTNTSGGTCLAAQSKAIKVG